MQDLAVGENKGVHGGLRHHAQSSKRKKALSRRPKPHFSEDRKDWWRFVKSASLSPSSDHLVLRQERSRQGQKLPKAERGESFSVRSVFGGEGVQSFFIAVTELQRSLPRECFFL